MDQWYPERGSVAWWQWAALSCLLVALLANGLCPGFYGAYLPSDHFMLDGPPPPDWDHQDHPNPLLAYFGIPVPTSAEPDHDFRCGSHTVVQQPLDRVISLSTSSAMSMLSQMTTDSMPPMVGAMVCLGLSGELTPAASVLPDRLVGGPPPPPPRTV